MPVVGDCRRWGVCGHAEVVTCFLLLVLVLLVCLFVCKQNEEEGGCPRWLKSCVPIHALCVEGLRVVSTAGTSTNNKDK